ncbi:MAG: LysR family transcriptional regulator, partial [Kiritimatiellae bacterium]|nr:LysR family transcriptional regulator [Kiritimatiellia bacterium]
GCPFGKLDVVANYNLIYNAAVFVEAGLGAAVCIDGMIPQEFAERVVFRPFAPALISDVYLAWRKNAALSPAASALVETVRAMPSSRQM